MPTSTVGKVVWVAVTAAVLVGGLLVVSQVLRGFSTFGEYDESQDPPSCTFTHSPSDAEIDACLKEQGADDEEFDDEFSEAEFEGADRDGTDLEGADRDGAERETGEGR
ncbi:MAG: hypothetical protein ACK5LO_11595 [Leucobacter sp.]